MKLQISIFDDQIKSFWNKGSKQVTRDTFELFKMKKKSLKKQSYTIDSSFVFGKVVKGQIDKQFPLITTTFSQKTREEVQQQVSTKENIAYGYEFRRKGKTMVLYATEDTHTNLIDILNRVCIRTDFHQTYVCQKLVNTGKFGMVFVGKNRNTEQQFAIKSFKKDYLKESSQFLQGLVNEITVNRQLLSDGLLPLIETFETDSSVYLIYEYTDGGKLLDRFKHQSGPKLNSYIVQAIMEKLVRTLGYVHSKGYMHRDLNPDNIIFRNQNDHSDVLIADMGFIDSIQKPTLIYKRCGNPGYVAPEILTYRVGSPIYDEKCDIFSLGTILFVLLVSFIKIIDRHKAFFRQFQRRNYQFEYWMRNRLQTSSAKKCRDQKPRLICSKNCYPRIQEKDPLPIKVLQHQFFLQHDLSKQNSFRKIYSMQGSSVSRMDSSRHVIRPMEVGTQNNLNLLRVNTKDNFMEKVQRLQSFNDICQRSDQFLGANPSSMSRSFDPEIYKLSSFIQNDFFDEVVVKSNKGLKASFKQNSPTSKIFIPSPSIQLLNEQLEDLDFDDSHPIDNYISSLQSVSFCEKNDQPACDDHLSLKTIHTMNFMTKQARVNRAPRNEQRDTSVTQSKARSLDIQIRVIQTPRESRDNL